MMDRFRSRARELRAFAERMIPLAKMPDRVTAADVQQATDLATKAADSLDELLTATPPGCECREIQTDNYSYLEYAESCRHHRHYYALSQKLSAEHARLTKVLKDEVRMKLVAAALSGSAALPEYSSFTDDLAKRAIAIADETIDRITREVP